MDTQTTHSQGAQTSAESELARLYRMILDAWNARSADAFAAPFAEDAQVVGFDGSLMNGRSEIALTLAQVFADHLTGRYFGKIRGVRALGPGAAILRAVAGMVPHGESDINPALNAIQTLVAEKQDGRWRAVHFQNTPAQFHGRPELVKQLTEELQQLL